MYTINVYCNDGANQQYWERGHSRYETYYEALNACYAIALVEVRNLMETADYDSWFEVEDYFEITEAYKTESLKDIGYFQVAVVFYDHAPWERENDCDIKIVTGYHIVEIEEE